MKFNKNEFGWSKKNESSSSSGGGLTPAQENKLNIAYNHSKEEHFSGDYTDLTNKPTNISEFNNDANYASETYVNNKIDEAQLGGDSGTVDLSGYVTKETGNASQITFADGQTFQEKLDSGTLKGDKGDSGANSIDDTITSATTTYSSNKIETIKENLSSQIRAIDGSDVSIEKFQLVVDILKKATFVEDVSAQFDRLDSLLNGQEVTTYTITNNLTNVTNSNLSTSARENSSYIGTLNADSNYTISSVTIIMGGTDITNSAYSNGTINISSITGNVIITAIATENAQSSGVTQSGSTLTITNATVSQTEGTLIIS